MTETHYEQQRAEHGDLMDEFVLRLQEAGIPVTPPVMRDVALSEGLSVRTATHWDFGGGALMWFHFERGSIQCPHGPVSVKPAIRSKTFKVRGPKSWEKLLDHVKMLVDITQGENRIRELKRKHAEIREARLLELFERYPEAKSFLSTDSDNYTFRYKGNDMTLLVALAKTVSTVLRNP